MNINVCVSKETPVCLSDDYKLESVDSKKLEFPLSNLVLADGKSPDYRPKGLFLLVLNQ